VGKKIITMLQAVIIQYKAGPLQP